MNLLGIFVLERTPDGWTSILSLAAAGLIYITITSIDRLFFGPLARFPGPKLAALTGLYETYFDCFLPGQYWVEIQRLHEKYGPVVRISPKEIHIDDVEFNQPYEVALRASKDPWYYSFIGNSTTVLGTEDENIHRLRRSGQSKYFTAERVEAFYPKLDVFVSYLISRLDDLKRSGQPVNLSDAFSCLTIDVIQDFAMHESANLLRSPDFAATFSSTLHRVSKLQVWHRHFGYILSAIQKLPYWIVARLDKMSIDLTRNIQFIDRQTKATFRGWKKKTLTREDTKLPQDKSPNFIYHMLDSQELRKTDKDTSRLALEMKTLVFKGTQTTANTLQAITFHLLKSPAKAAKLRSELRTAQKAAGNADLSYKALQQLPYLSAIITEGHRISSSISGRLARFNPRGSMRYKEWFIPAGTVVSTTQKLIHDNPAIFPNPQEFMPERWLEAEERTRLEEYLKPFGRGSRSCLGMHLANAEIFVTVAKLFGTFDMELFETSELEIDQYSDYFSPCPKSSKGLRVILK